MIFKFFRKPTFKEDNFQNLHLVTQTSLLNFGANHLNALDS